MKYIRVLTIILIAQPKTAANLLYTLEKNAIYYVTTDFNNYFKILLL